MKTLVKMIENMHNLKRRLLKKKLIPKILTSISRNSSVFSNNKKKNQRISSAQLKNFQLAQNKTNLIKYKVL